MKLFFILIISTLFYSCRKDNLKNQYDVIVVAGQSNNYFGYDVSETTKIYSDKILQLGRKDSTNLKIISTDEELHHYSSDNNNGGYAMTFANSYVKQKLKKNRKVLLIPCARFGTSFINNNWNKGDKYYNDAIMRIKYVLNKFPNSKLTCILWHQGESDEGNHSYQSNLDTFITNFRKDLILPNTPFICGGMVPYWTKQNQNRITIQNIIENTPNRLPFIGYASPYLPFIINKKDDSENSVHYNAVGLVELGHRYFNSFLNLN